MVSPPSRGIVVEGVPPVAGWWAVLVVHSTSTEGWKFLDQGPERKGHGSTQRQAQGQEEGHDGPRRLCFMRRHLPVRGQKDKLQTSFLGRTEKTRGITDDKVKPGVKSRV